mmetsp:Transcript_106015/g.296733  ORF Transcript_106015/g.296733 Transcript_106015/m.296733 type:complete len:221 (+) Transcript_106015:145-807(+)
MEEGLPHSRRHARVVVRPVLRDALRHEVPLPPAVWPADLRPTPDLPIVVVSAPPLVEPAIPLEPTVWVLLAHPTCSLPILQRVATLRSVLVDALAILRPWPSDVTGDVQALQPARRQLLPSVLVGLAGDGGLDITEVRAAESTRPQDLLWRLSRAERRHELLQFGARSRLRLEDQVASRRPPALGTHCLPPPAHRQGCHPGRLHNPAKQYEVGGQAPPPR